MAKPITSRRELKWHQSMIERSLADFTSGKNTRHLSPMEINQTIKCLEARLASIKDRLQSGSMA